MLQPLNDIFRPEDYPNLLVGLTSADDAAVWRLSKKKSLVLTTDFFTPVVDDPYDYGAIAAANSLSDVYAMGANPFLALNLVSMPANLPLDMVRQILLGGAEKAREAGVVIAGGHTIQDKEPKFGLVVLGLADERKLMTKGGMQPGDCLYVTKPLGFGVVTTAHKRGLTGPEDLQEVITWMKTLNRDAGELAVTVGVRAATDVTGYSLLGHALEMAEASGVGISLDFQAIPMVSSARKFAQAFTFPGGAHDNAAYFGEKVSFDPRLSEAERMLLFDPQTSGGLLISVPQNKTGRFQSLAKEKALNVWKIGQVEAGRGIQVD